MTEPSVSVVVITRNRPTILEQCLDRLGQQSRPALEILVVDASDRFQPVERAGVTHLCFPAGKNQMPKARNEGVRRSRGEIIAFLDDDCLADPDWLEELLRAYLDRPELAGVGGRITDARWKFNPEQPVGRAYKNGELVANFFGDPGEVVSVDFLPGGNMSFRRDWLMRVRGFDANFVATNHREDPDLCLRLRALGACLAYQPKAHAHHLNARNALGELKRWHELYLRYSFARNEGFFLARHFPHRIWQRWLIDTGRQLQRALAGRSLVALACVPVVAISYGLGLASYTPEIKTGP